MRTEPRGPFTYSASVRARYPLGNGGPGRSWSPPPLAGRQKGVKRAAKGRQKGGRTAGKQRGICSAPARATNRQRKGYGSGSAGAMKGPQKGPEQARGEGRRGETGVNPGWMAPRTAVSGPELHGAHSPPSPAPGRDEGHLCSSCRSPRERELPQGQERNTQNSWTGSPGFHSYAQAVGRG